MKDKIFDDKAEPRAKAIPLATIGTLDTIPASLSKRCIEPPLPLQHPFFFPSIGLAAYAVLRYFEFYCNVTHA